MKRNTPPEGRSKKLQNYVFEVTGARLQEKITDTYWYLEHRCHVSDTPLDAEFATAADGVSHVGVRIVRHQRHSD